MKEIKPVLTKKEFVFIDESHIIPAFGMIGSSNFHPRDTKNGCQTKVSFISVSLAIETLMEQFRSVVTENYGIIHGNESKFLAHWNIWAIRITRQRLKRTIFQLNTPAQN